MAETHSVECLTGPLDAPLYDNCPRCQEIRRQVKPFIGALLTAPRTPRTGELQVYRGDFERVRPIS